MSEQLLNTFLGILATFFTGLITVVLLPAISRWLSAKTNSQNIQTVIDELTQTVQTSVGYINQTFVNQLKADGKFDADNQEEALRRAVEDVVNNLSLKTKELLGKDGIDIQNIIIRYIEAQISSSKFPGILFDSTDCSDVEIPIGELDITELTEDE